MSKVDGCTAVSYPDCPLESTLYGYYPNLGVNVFFVAFFALAAIAHAGAAIRWKTYFFGAAMTLGSIGEAIGYVGRIMLNRNPYDSTAFSMQISCLIFCPAFYAGAIYLTLKHIVLTFGESKSRIPAYLYTWIFIICDVISLLLQAIGGGIASSAADDNESLVDLGTNLMISGVVWQVAVLLVFAYLVIEYTLRTRKDRSGVPESADALSSTPRFRRFAIALVVAYCGVFFRSVYRIAEMAEGWAKPIMQLESGFIVMEGFMIVIAVLALTLFHPGYCFPQMSNQRKRKDLNVESAAESASQTSEK